MPYQLNNTEQKKITEIESKSYMKPIIKLLYQHINGQRNKKEGWKSAFNNLHELLVKAKPLVDKILKKRAKKGELKDIKQARKNIAGNAFSKLLEYVFIQNKLQENIKADIFITSQKSKVKNFDTIATINVDGETQKPDCDLIIYSLKKNNDIKKCIILSLKTSLRERAGQTYKWKLLMEIASSENSIKEKYNISYNPHEMPIVCFATVNFYDEINNPQHRGMFKFFDKSFIAKNVNKDFISPLSEIINFVNLSL